MIVTPYKKRPKAPRIAIVNDDGNYIDEFGNVFPPSSEYKFKRNEIVCFILWDTAITLTKHGIGEFSNWNSKDTRWRATIYLEEQSWKSRPLDAGIIQLPISTNYSHDNLLKEIVEFRDWLDDEGARAQCTFGSMSVSLLRATIRNPIFTGMGGRNNTPPIEYTRGGRQFIPDGGTGKYEGRIINWDLPAAYASCLGHTMWNGHWTKCYLRHAIKAYERGAPVYCYATVDIPDISVGPLPDTFSAHPPNPLASSIHHKFGYPVGKTLEGIWALDELFQAEQVGCKFEPHICWAMMSQEMPFLKWWEAILRGRELSGAIARSLSKRTGNSLVGTFAKDPRVRSKKIAIHYVDGKRKIRRLNFNPNTQVPGHDLAESITGAVRAKLYENIVAAGSHLLSAHTDGVWVKGEYDVPEGWRIKQEARRIDLIDPQNLRYFIDSRNYRVVMSGVPFKVAAEEFEKRWRKFEERNLSDNSNLSDVR